MGAITILASGQKLILSDINVYETGENASIYSDSTLETAVTLPVNFSADYTFYAEDAEDLVVTVTQLDGTTLLSERVTPQPLVTPKLKPLPTGDQLVADMDATRTGNAALTATKTDDYTVTLADAGKRVVMSKATAVTLTVPANVFAAGDEFQVYTAGAGKVIVAAGAGLTLRAPAGPRTTAQYASARVWFVSATVAVVDGSVEANA